MLPNRIALFLAALMLAACNNGQPRIYKIAIDTSPLNPVADPSCYFGNTAPDTTVETTNLRVEEQWVVWDAVGTDGSPMEYLDPGEQKAHLGNSPAFDFNNTIETTQPGTFVGTQRASESFSNNAFTEVRDATIQFNFSDQGASPTGTMTLHSEYACTPMNNCPQPQAGLDMQSCSVTLTFTARRIDASRIDGYTDVGSGGSASGSASSLSGN